MEWKCTSYKTFLPILSLYWTRSTFFTSTSPQAEPLTGSVLTRDKFKEVLHSDQSENLINISLWGTRRLVLSGLHAFHNHKTMEQLVRNVRFFYPSWKMIIPWWRTRPSPGCWSKATWRSSIGQKSSVGASYQNTSSFGQAVIGVDWSSNPVSSGTVPMSEMNHVVHKNCICQHGDMFYPKPHQIAWVSGTTRVSLHSLHPQRRCRYHRRRHRSRLAVDLGGALLSLL
jgi:hypothetical protein